jgi:hydrogenase maturation protein HypF
MAEYGLEQALALAFDGTGYGADGTIWGGEFLRADRRGFQRLGCFRPFPLPGGEAAVLHPIRIALALLSEHLSAQECERLFCRSGRMSTFETSLLLEMVQRRLNCPVTSSLGRIFDAAAALLGLVDRVAYEGEGPIRLEGLAVREPGAVRSLSGEEQDLRSLVPLSHPQGQHFLLDPARLLLEMSAAAGPAGPAALRFHRAIALAALEGARELRRSTGLEQLVLSGGVFQNVLLLDLLLPALRRDGFQVYTHRLLPPGDGGLAVGQVYFQPDL